MKADVWIKIPTKDGAEIRCAFSFERLIGLGISKRDLHMVAWCLEHGCPVSDGLREFLAAVLVGKVKAFNNRNPSMITQMRIWVMRFLVDVARANGTKNSEDDVAELFGVTRRTVDRALEATKFGFKGVWIEVQFPDGTPSWFSNDTK
jgi:hypothetical protein